jgi:hypothetical protein
VRHHFYRIGDIVENTDRHLAPHRSPNHEAPQRCKWCAAISGKARFSVRTRQPASGYSTLVLNG